jgi:uncharacterized protein YjdB
MKLLRIWLGVFTLALCVPLFLAGCSGSGKSSNDPVAVTGINLKATTWILINGSEQLSADIVPANASNKSVTWKSSDENVATVDSTGKVSGVGLGDAVITTITDEGSFSAGCYVNVSYAYRAVSSLTLDSTAISTIISGTTTLKSKILPANASFQNVVWTSSDKNIASVSSDSGSSITVTGVAAGKATITATSLGDSTQMAICTVTVTKAVTSIKVSGAAAITGDSGTVQLSAEITPSDANQTISWISGSPLVASVSSAGLVTGNSNGSAVISAVASDGSGITASCTINVSGQSPMAYFIKQANADVTNATTAVKTGSSIAIHNTYSSSGNAFKYVAPNYYGTQSNGFIAYPSKMDGNFSVSAIVAITVENKGNNACGVAVGLTTGFAGTDEYAYTMMRNSSKVANGYYVNGAGSIGAETTNVNVPYLLNVPVSLSLSRDMTAKTLTSSATNTSTSATGTNTAATSYYTDGITVYSEGSVYPCISWNNADATITSFIVKDLSGNTVYDLSTGKLVAYIPASLAIGSTSATVNAGGSATISLTAVGIGGGVSSVTLTNSDSTVVNATVENKVTGSVINLTGLKGGYAVLTITNGSDANTSTKSKTIAVTVNQYQKKDAAYGSLSSSNVYPAPGSTSAYAEGEIAITFDNTPTLNNGGSINIYKRSDQSLVDTIYFDGDSQALFSAKMGVGNQMVRVSGNTVYIRPHVGALAYNTAYYVAIPNFAITAKLNGADFAGLSDNCDVASWNFTTKSVPTIDATNVTVDGSTSCTATFHSIQGALSYLGANSTDTNITIKVAAGTYYELLRYEGTVAGQTVAIVGPAGNSYGDTCVISYTNGNNYKGNGSTQTRPSFYFKGANLVLKNIKLVNTGTKAAVAQAETIYFASGWGYTMAAYNCGFSSWQDTIQTSGRNWFYKCYIEGNTDFIWGTADAALFENCSLKVRNDGDASAKTQSIAVARTSAWIGGTQPTATAVFSSTNPAGTIGKGYVFVNNTIYVDTIPATLGRDAGTGSFYDQVAFINNSFSGTGSISNDTANKNVSWAYSTSPLVLSATTYGYVGWKQLNNDLGSLKPDAIAAAATTKLWATSVTGTSIANTVADEYNTRENILNRFITVSAKIPTGFQAATTTWDLTSLESDFGATANAILY